MPTALIHFHAVRRLQGIALLLAMWCAAALAQAGPTASARASAAANGHYRIAGTVVNAVTGEPVRRATVAVLTEEDGHVIESVESDNDGHFALERLPAAKYQLTASKRGFRTAFYDEHEEFSTAIVTGPDQETDQLSFRLVPGSVLRGVVTADGGDPVQGAHVMLFLKPKGHRMNEAITQVGNTVSDDTGAYEFGNLAPGEYLLAVQAQPWYALHRAGGETKPRPANDPSAALDVAYPVTYFDSTVDEAAAAPIVLAGGNREEANVVLHAVPALHLSISVSPNRQDERAQTEPTMRQSVFGTQVSQGFSVNWVAAQPSGAEYTDLSFVSTIPAAGRGAQSHVVEFTGVAPGHYELTQGDPPRIVDLDATESQQMDPALGTPTQTVAGTLRTGSGPALTEQDNLILELRDSERRRSPIQTAGNRGAFNFAPVPPGTWELWAWGSGRQLQITSITIGNRTHAGNLLTVRDRPLSITVMVSQGETRVQGFAKKDGKGLPGAMVVLVPRDMSAFEGLVRRDQSDSDGSFSLRDVIPGQYTVVAIEDAWEMDWSRPEVIGRFLPRGISVTVTDTSGRLVRLSEPVPVQSR
jgi:hypothetical protein